MNEKSNKVRVSWEEKEIQTRKFTLGGKKKNEEFAEFYPEMVSKG